MRKPLCRVENLSSGPSRQGQTDRLDRSYQIAYADTGFLVSLYGQDDHSLRLQPW